MPGIRECGMPHFSTALRRQIPREVRFFMSTGHFGDRLGALGGILEMDFAGIVIPVEWDRGLVAASISDDRADDS